MFPEDDDHVLEYLVDEGQSIEPEHYLPIVPLTLINGAEGIGTGWSTFIPSHDPRHLVANIRRMMNGQELEPMHPWYKDFDGTIEPADEGNRYLVTGNYEVTPKEDDEDGDCDRIEITELPLQKWTGAYKAFLEEMAQADEATAKKKGYPTIQDIKEYHQENKVHFDLRVPNVSKMSREEILKKFKLQTSLSTANLVAFDPLGRVTRYATALDLIREWYRLRSALYDARKAYLLARLQRECETLRNKVKFILAIVQDQLKVNNVKRKVLLQVLKGDGYTMQSELEKMHQDGKRSVRTAAEKPADEDAEAEAEDQAMEDEGEIQSSEYDYLLRMPLWSLTEEKVLELQE